MANCVVCGEMVNGNGLKYIEMNTGDRERWICCGCGKRMNRKAIGETTDSKPALKNLINQLSVSIATDENGETAMKAKVMGKGGMVTKVGNSPAVMHMPRKTRLNSAIRFCNETLPALNRIYGATATKWMLTLESGVLSKVYVIKETENPAEWIRDCEDDFCNLIGCPQWSAKKTGTRK